jgi:hypothetical protein
MLKFRWFRPIKRIWRGVCAGVLPMRFMLKKVKRQLVLNKGKEKFIFRYESGYEDQLLDALISQAKDKRTSFDWFDAAVLSFRLTQSLIGQANEILRDNTDTQVHAN